AGPALSLRRRHAPAPGVSPARRRVLSYFKAWQDRCSDGMGEPVRRGMGERRLSGQVARLAPKAALGAPYLNCPNAPSQPVFDIVSRLYGPTGTPARAVRHHSAALFCFPDLRPSSTAIRIKRQFSADFRRTQNRRLSPIVALNSGFGQTKSPENRSSRAFEDGAPGRRKFELPVRHTSRMESVS